MKKVALKLSLVLLVVFGFTACEEDQEKKDVKALQEKFDATMKETIAIHDEVMPEMGMINQLLTDLEYISNALGKEQEEQYKTTITSLEEAHKEMMHWMKELSNTFNKEEVNDGITTEDTAELKTKIEQLDQLKESAEQMRKSVITSIREGEALRSSYKKENTQEE